LHFLTSTGEGTWNLTHQGGVKKTQNDTWGEGGVKDGSKINTYFLNGPLAKKRKQLILKFVLKNKVFKKEMLGNMKSKVFVKNCHVSTSCSASN